MSQPLRAIYKNGQLRLLDPVNLAEGEEVHLMILSDEERARAALSDLLVNIPDTTDDALDEDALAHEIEADFRGQPPLSETIMEERREGP